MRKEDREKKIASICKAIESSKDPNYKKLEIVFSAKFGISTRTIREYLQIAKYKCGKK